MSRTFSCLWFILLLLYHNILLHLYLEINTGSFYRVALTNCSVTSTQNTYLSNSENICLSSIKVSDIKIDFLSKVNAYHPDRLSDQYSM